MQSNSQENVTFVAIPKKEIFSSQSNDFKIYSVDVDVSKYPGIKLTQYNTVTIKGVMQKLTIGVEYTVLATEKWDNKYNSFNYEVENISLNKPSSSMSMYEFLKEILTERQATTLYNTYPNIVNIVMEDRDNEIDVSKLNGIGQKTLVKIVKKIKDNYKLSELIKEFSGQLPYRAVRLLYEKYYGNVELVKEKIQKNPYKCLCNLSGIGFVTADTIILKMQDKMEENIKNGIAPSVKFDKNLRKSKERCLACIDYFIQKGEENGDTAISCSKVFGQCQELVPECISEFYNALNDENIVYNRKRNLICRRCTYDKEKYVAETINKALSINNNIEKWDNVNKELYRCVDGYQLTDEQTQALDNICKYNICILNGYAGTGKTSSTKAIINMCRENEITFSLLAPTGRAAKVLSEYTDEVAQTIHRGLCYMPPEWGMNELSKLSDDLVICDEMSMCDLDVFYHLVQAIDFSKTKLLLIGDDAQLPSVGCGNIFHDLLNSKKIPTASLTKIFRYGEGGLMKVATDVREGMKYLVVSDKNIIPFGEKQDYIFANMDDKYIIDQMIKIYSKMLSQGYSPEDVQVLTAYRKGEFGSVAINKELQKVANCNYGSNKVIQTKNDISFYENDIVIQTKNNYHAHLFDKKNQTENNNDIQEDTTSETTFIANGDVGTIEKIISDDKLCVNFSGKKVLYTINDLLNVELAYCITLHKSQGGSIKCPIVITPKAHTYMLSSNLLYVALTRTKKQCFHFGNISTINKCVKKKDNVTRNTVLPFLLK